MRILAIRAKNLASIPSFELDLFGGALSKTRIFAITGPTGAGKSTLLDALCLALYDRAPRLEGARDVSLGELEVGATDPRSLMRRGSIEALAEVDFLGNDDRRYRATWEVWRARRRSDGKLQSQRMRFARIEPFADLTGSTKTETLARIEATVGLSFSEFRRAVLLAQGDFAAFLEARPDQRAELLEKMTGTEIYAEISRAAFARAKEEDETLRRLEAERANQRPMEVEARAGLDRERASLIVQRAALEVELAAARRAAAWHEEQERLAREHSEAATAHQLAERAWIESEEDRSLLEARASAEALRPAFEGEVGASRALVEARARAEAAAAELSAASEDRRRGEAERAQAEALSVRARGELAVARPELERARAIDVKIAEAAREHGLAASDATKVSAQLSSARIAVEELERALEETQRALTLIDADLAAAKDVERIAAQWPRWKEELERLIAADLERSRAVERAEEGALAAAQAKSSLSARDAALIAADERARARAEEVAAARRSLEAHRAKAPPRGVQDAVERIAKELASIEAMKVLSSETRRIGRQIEEEDRAAKEEKKAAGEKREAVKLLRERRKELEAKIEALRDERDRVETERDLAMRRHELLSEGEPCPLCGAIEHPAIHEEPEKNTRHRSVKRRLERAENELEEVRRELAAMDEAVQSHARAAERSAKEAEALGPELERRAKEFRERAERIELLWVDSPVLAARAVRQVALLLPESADARNAAADLDRTAAKLSEHREALRAALAEDEALVKALEERGDALELAERKKRELAPGVELARAAERASAEKAAKLVAEVVRIEARRTEALAALAQALSVRAEWMRAAESDPVLARERLGVLVASWEARRRERGETAEMARKQSEQLAWAGAERARLEQDAVRAREVAEARAKHLAGLRAERAEVLEGRDAAEVAVALERAVSDAERRAEEARKIAVEAKTRVAAAEERVKEAARAAEEGERRAKAAIERLEREIEASGWPDRLPPRSRVLVEAALGARVDADVDAPSAERAAGGTTREAGALTRRGEAAPPALDNIAGGTTREATGTARGEAAPALGNGATGEATRDATGTIRGEAAPALGNVAGEATRDAPGTARSSRFSLARAALASLLAIAPRAIASLERRIADLRESLSRSAATLDDRRRRLDAHADTTLAAGDAGEARATLARLERAFLELVDRDARLAQAIAHDDEVLSRVRALGPAIDAQRSRTTLWSTLNQLIGSADGKKLRTFAQGLTLDLLIEHANAHLAELRPRYRLQRARGHDMELAVVDGDMGDEIRAVTTLSGGETFLVSLALALGLSTLSAKEISINSLFIDEGFGALDRDTLEIALATLDRLQAEGRTIGLISHVPDLAERIGYQIHVRPTGPGRSEVVVLEG